MLSITTRYFAPVWDAAKPYQCGLVARWSPIQHPYRAASPVPLPSLSRRPRSGATVTFEVKMRHPAGETSAPLPWGVVSVSFHRLEKLRRSIEKSH